MPPSQLPESCHDQSKAELQLILNAVVECLCGLDAAGRVTFCNDALLKMTGYRTEEIIGTNLFELLRHTLPDETTYPTQKGAFCQAPDTHRAIHIKSGVFWRKDGTCFPAEYWLRPLQCPSSLTACVVTLHDITDIQHAKEVVGQREDKSRRILANVPDVAWTSDRRGRTIYISPKVEAIFGYTTQEICAQGANRWMGRIHPEDFGPVKHAYNALFENQTAFDMEYRLHRKDDAWIWVHDRAMATRKENGVLYADGIFSDITHRKQAEAELQSKTAFLEAQANSTIDGILVVGRGNQRILLNQRLVELFKIPPALCANQDDRLLLDYVATLVNDPERFLARVHHLNRHPRETTHDEIEFKDGMILDRYSAPVIDPKGIYYGRIWTFRDITERKRDEERLRTLSRAVEQSPATVVITDIRGKIEYVNPKFSQLTGYSAQEAIGQNPRLLKSGRQSPELYRELWRTVLAGGEWCGELANKKKNGEIYWEAASIVAIKDSGGAITHLLAVKEDITERKRAEHATRESEQRYRLLFERNLAGVFRSTLDGRFLDCNQAAARILGFDKIADVLSVHASILYHSSSDREALLTKLKSEKQVTNLEMRYRRKDGNVVWVIANFTLVADQTAGSEVVEGTFIDITERKKSEQAIRESERFLQSTLDALSSHVAILDNQGEIVAVNAAWRRFMAANGGAPDTCGVGANYLEICRQAPPGCVEANAAAAGIGRAIAGAGTEFSIEYPCHSPEQKRWFVMRATPFGDGSDVRVVIAHENITNRKLAEEAVRESAARYRHLFERNLAGVYRTTISGRILECNQAVARMFGYDSPEEVMALPILDWYDTASDQDAFLTKLKSEKIVANYEMRFRRKNGDPFWVIGNMSLIDDGSAADGIIQGTIVDITERKQTEKQLRLTQFSVEHASDSIFWIEPQGRILYVNQAACRTLGYTQDELLSLSIPDIAPLFPRDHWSEFWQTLKTQGSMTFESTHITKQRKMFPVEVTVNYREFDGKEYGFAFVRDITERKRAEKELRLAQFSVEHASEAIYWINPQGRIVFANEAACRSLGRSREELVALSIADIDPLAPQETWPAFWEKLKIQGSVTLEGRHKTKQGRLFPVEITASYLEYDGQEYSFAFARDITERKQAEEEVREGGERVRLVLDSVPEAVYGIDLKGNCTFCNPACLQLLGYREASELLGRNMHVVMHHTRPDGMPYPVEECHIYEAFRRGYGTHIDNEVLWRQDGTSFPAEYWSHPMLRGGTPVGTVVTFIDITERKQTQEALRASEERYRLLFERNLAGIFRTALDGGLLECNPAAARLFGYDSPEEILALPMANVHHSISERDAFLRKLKSEKSLTNHEMRFRRKNGDSAWAMLNVSLVDDHAGAPGFIEGTFVDITERKVAEEKVQSLAYYDALTGLPNRILLRDRLSQALATARRQKHKVALLFLDLDRFKIINDSLGHSVGDLLLQEVAERLKKCARDQDTVARLGGDEFLIVLTNQKDIPDAAVAAERFMDAMVPECVIQGHSLSISCSLGISIFPEHGADSETLIKNADAAMYGAKDSGRNNFQFFTADMNAQAVERLTMENGLRSALDKKELFLVYQPQMEMATGKIVGLEALLRWQHPELGLVPPGQFIRIAENSGLIMPIGEWVLKTACSQARKWQEAGLASISVAVNVSAVQFRQESFPKTIRKVLEETGLPPQCLELELTESLLLSNADVMFSVLQQLTAMGLRLAIDDFGTGYSSFSYLKQFPVSKLKIDRSFIRDVAVNPDDAAITTAIISMAKSLNLKVIAEGVETEAQMSFLRIHQCDEIQGYYFSKPLAADEVAAKLQAGHSKTHGLSS